MTDDKSFLDPRRLQRMTQNLKAQITLNCLTDPFYFAVLVYLSSSAFLFRAHSWQPSAASARSIPLSPSLFLPRMILPLWSLLKIFNHFHCKNFSSETTTRDDIAIRSFDPHVFRGTWILLSGPPRASSPFGTKDFSQSLLDTCLHHTLSTTGVWLFLFASKLLPARLHSSA